VRLAPHPAFLRPHPRSAPRRFASLNWQRGIVGRLPVSRPRHSTGSAMADLHEQQRAPAMDTGTPSSWTALGCCKHSQALVRIIRAHVDASLQLRGYASNSCGSVNRALGPSQSSTSPRAQLETLAEVLANELHGGGQLPPSLALVAEPHALGRTRAGPTRPGTESNATLRSS
jgi:hypothetical protein